MPQSSSTGERVEREIGLESFRSIMIAAYLKILQGFCFILTEFCMVLATSEERVYAPPVGYVRVYEEAMMADLCFLLHPFM